MTRPKDLHDWHLRWIVRNDMPQVVEIDVEAFGMFAHGEKGILDNLRERNCICMVAEPYRNATYICGFVIYSLLPSRVHLETLAVGWQWRRTGCGKAMLDKVKSKMSASRRRMVTALVRETNDESIGFLASQGFRATEIVRGICADIDYYRFECGHEDYAKQAGVTT